MADVQTTVVVTAAIAPTIKEISRRMGKVDLNGMFLTGLSATGIAPATHFISSGLVRQEYLNVITDNVRLFNAAKAAWEADGNVFPYTQTQVTAARTALSISDGTFNNLPEGPHEFIARLGLKIVRGTL